MQTASPGTTSSKRSPTTKPASSSKGASCSRCGVGCDAQAWREFELVERVASERLQEFVTIWPDDTVIEVRRCACGQVVARKLRSRPQRARRSGMWWRSRQEKLAMTMNADQERARFDRWAPRYDRSIGQFLLFSPTHAAVLSAAAVAGCLPRSVLDVGCGTGRLLERAAEQWKEAALVGIDASPKMIDEARTKLSIDSRFRFEVADAAALPLEPASVDLALSTVSFHHWSDQAGGVREVARVLGAGGIFVLADLAPPFFRGSLMGRVHGVHSRGELFEQAGLNMVRQWRPMRLAGHVLITVGRKG